MLPPPVNNLHVAFRRRPAVAEQFGVCPRREDDGVEPEQEDECDHHRVLGAGHRLRHAPHVEGRPHRGGGAGVEAARLHPRVWDKPAQLNCDGNLARPARHRS